MASEVDTFLEGLELKEYADAFKQNGFTNLQSCCTLNEDKLQELGVIKRGHQKRILRNLPVDALQSIQQDMSDMIDESGSRQSYPQGSGDTTSIIQMPEFDEKKYFLIPPVKHDISAKPHPVPQPRMRKIKPDLDYPAPMSSCEPSLKTLKQKPDVPPRPPSIGMRPVETPVTQSISNGQISNKESVIQIPSEKTPDLPAKTKPKPPVRTTPIMDNNSTSSPAVLPDTLKSCEDTTKIIDIIPSQPISRPPPINLRVSEPSPGTTASSRRTPDNMTASGPSPGTTTTSGPLAGNMTASGPSPGTITTSGPLAGNMTASGPSPGTTTTSGPLAGNMTDTGPSPGTTTTSGPLAGNMAASGPSPGTTTTSEPLAGNMTDTGPSPGTTTTSGPLAGNMTATGPSPGTTTTSGPLAGNMTASGPSPGTTTTSGPLVGNMTKFLDIIPPRPISGPPPINMRASGPSQGTTTISGIIPDNMTTSRQSTGNMTDSGPPPVNITDSGLSPGNMQASRPSPIEMTAIGHPSMAFGPSPGNSTSLSALKNKSDSDGEDYVSMGKSHIEDTNPEFDVDGTAYDILVNKTRNRAQPVTPRKTSDLINLRNSIAVELPSPQEPYNTINLLDSIEPIHMEDSCRSSKPPPDCPPPPPPFACKDPTPLQTFVKEVIDIDNLPPPPPPRVDSIYLEEPRPVSIPQASPARPAPPPPVPPTMIPLRIGNEFDGSVSGDIDDYEVLKPPHKPPQLPSLPALPNRRRPREPLPVPIPQAPPARLAPPPPDNPTIIPLIDGSEFDGSASGGIDDYEVLKPPHYSSQLPSLPAHPNIRHREQQPVPISQAPPVRSAPPPPDTPMKIPLVDDDDEFDDGASRDCQSEDSDTSDEMLDYDSRMNEISPKAKSLEKSGFLYKQGGKQNTKGWRKRWVVFNGKDLRYYISKE
uniref:Formin-like protein 20-like n=1 Tax=Saccoglossus kowalevskii TaxID=10224 RepID=A0ABM0M2G7_SACKO